jgi:manganese/zinc/iron transport system permease protein
MIELIQNLLFDYTLRTVALGTGILGIVSGVLGSYAVLRKQSLLGDALSHAALPGIVLAFLLTGSKEPVVLLLGAAIAGLVATLLMMNIIRLTRIKTDSALGLVLSVFFGFGLMLLTFVQRLPNAGKAGLDKFLFGQAATLLESDVIVMSILGAVGLAIVVFFWKEFKLLSFDPEYGASLGLPTRLLDVLLTTLLVIAIAVGLQTVGVVLMSAMVVAPAAAARQWTDRLGKMVGLAAMFGALAGISGAMLSSTAAHLPTGPTIVLCISTIVLLSLLLAPNRGLVWNWVRHQRSRQQLEDQAVLRNMYDLAQQHDDLGHAHSVNVLRTMEGGRPGVHGILEKLSARGWARQVDAAQWALTPAGQAEAERLEKERSR